MTINLRHACLDDIADITRIYRQSVLTRTSCYELDPPDMAEMERRMRAILDAGFPYLIAEDEHKAVLGYAYAGPFRTRRAYRFLVEDSIYLDEKAQGRGIGKKLLARLIEDCTQLGFRQMIAVIGGASPASVALHSSLGFQHAGGIQGSGYKFDQWLDTVFMQKTLGEGRETVPIERVFPA